MCELFYFHPANRTDELRQRACHEEMVSSYDYDLKLAVMGCVVNGPGEAKEADLGIAGGDGCGVLIKHGEVVCKVPEDELLSTLKYELDHWGGTGV